jgi:glutathione S-transferase
LQPQPLPALVAFFALLVYLALAINVARKRRRLGIEPPTMDGPPDFVRAIRIHLNTLEHIVLFLPALALFTIFQGGFWAAVIGVFWPVGRIIYAVCYARDPRSRLPGFIMAMLATLILLFGGALGALLRMT